MRDWPPITEPELLERLALDDEQFAAFVWKLIAAWPRREFDPAAFEHALGYPWERPPGSYILSGDDVALLRDVDPAKRESTVVAFTEERHPIVSFGANASPARLAMKFKHFPSERDREVLVLTGDLHDLDVGAVPSVPLLGYMPASLFASPGTAVRAAVIWVTPAQVEQLAWSEMTYRLGRLEQARFAVDEAALEIDDLFAFVARLGAFCIDGAPVALAAIPATNRTAAALTQAELLDVVARLVLGPDAHAEHLMRAACDDMPAVMARAARTVWPCGQQLASRWTPFPAAGSRR
ncbi:MAG TPA: hypothetical protein VK506_11230 [Conexibacter sp.]|nr:hypothetical protein [Conexibacter sp.]